MVEIKDPEIVEREKFFIPDEITFLNFVVSDYSNPIAPDPKTYAEYEYDKTTKNLSSIKRSQCV